MSSDAPARTFLSISDNEIVEPFPNGREWVISALEEFIEDHYTQEDYEDQMYEMFGEDWEEMPDLAPFEERVRMNAEELYDCGETWGFTEVTDDPDYT